MKRCIPLYVEQLEARNTPSSVSSVGTFLPPGVIRGFNPQPDPPGLPAVVQIRDGSVAFVPPGITHGGWSPDGTPPPVQATDGSVPLVDTAVDQTHDFHASGTWAVSVHGSHLEGTRSGS